MANSIANLFLRIFSQKGDAKSDVDQLAASLEALDHVKAEAKAEVNTDKGSLDQLTFELDKFDHKKVDAKAGVDTAAGEAQLKLFSEQLSAFSARSFKGQILGIEPGSISRLFGHFGDQLKIPVELDDTKAKVEAASLHEQLKLFLPDEHVNVDVDTSKLSLTERLIGSLGSALGSLSSEGAGVGGMFANMGENLSKVTVNFGMFGLRLGPILIAVLALAAGIGISLVGALIAVVSSAVLAATALGALGIALLGALGPMAAIAIPAALAFSKVLSALTTAQQGQTAAQKDATAAARQAIQAQSQAHAYAEQRAAAEQALTQAVQQATQARAQAYREEQDAIQAVTDASLALKDAELARTQAGLNFEKAKQALKDFRDQLGLTGKKYDAMFKTFSDVAFDPTKLNAALSKIKDAAGSGITADQQIQLKQLILDVANAKQGEADATNNVTHAETTLTRARQDAAPFLKEGIRASKQYQAALQGVASAQQNLNQIQSDYIFNQQQQAKLNALNAQSAANQSSKVSRLSAEELKLYKALKLVIAAFKEAFGPAVNALLDGFINGLKFLPPLMNSLRGPMLALGKAMGSVITDFFKQSTDSGARNFFLVFINGARQLLPYINKIFGPMLDILGKIATAAMPFLVQGFKDIAKFMGQLDKGLTIKNIRDFIAQIIPNLTEWVNLALQLIPNFFKYMIQVAPYGIKFLQWVGGIAVKLGQWSTSARGRSEIKSFFTTAIPLAEQFLGLAVTIMSWVVNVTELFIKGWKAVSDFFNAFMTFDLNKFIIDLFKGNWGQALADTFNKKGMAIANALVNGINSIRLDIKKFLDDKFRAAFIFLGSLPSKFYNWGKNMILGLVRGAENFFTHLDLVGWITKPINRFLQWLGISSPSTRFFTYGQDIIQGLLNGLKSIGSAIFNFFWSNFQASFRFISDLPSKFFEFGKKIVEGLWNGIKSVALDVAGWAKHHLLDPVTSILGIGSPSKVMIAIGKDVAKGFQIGLDVSANNVQTAIVRSFVGPLPAAISQTSAARLGAGGSSGNGVTIQHQEVNLPPAPGSDQMGDPRHQAALFAREMRRRGWR